MLYCLRHGGNLLIDTTERFAPHQVNPLRIPLPKSVQWDVKLYTHSLVCNEEDIKIYMASVVLL